MNMNLGMDTDSDMDMKTVCMDNDSDVLRMLMSKSISTCLSPCPSPCPCTCLLMFMLMCDFCQIIFMSQLSGHGHGTGHKHLCVKLIVENWFLSTDAILNLEICFLPLAWRLKIKLLFNRADGIFNGQRRLWRALVAESHFLHFAM
jgi:hypothetical protein